MPRPDGTVRLPMDPPPSNRVTRLPLVQGIRTIGAAGEIAYPLPTVPWNSTESVEFPAYERSEAAATIGTSGPFPVRAGRPNMNAWRWKWVVSTNSFSPVSHRTPAALRDSVPPRVISARGVGAVTQRPRGYAVGFATRWPNIAPQWPTWGESRNPRTG